MEHCCRWCANAGTFPIEAGGTKCELHDDEWVPYKDAIAENDCKDFKLWPYDCFCEVEYHRERKPRVKKQPVNIETFDLFCEQPVNSEKKLMLSTRCE